MPNLFNDENFLEKMAEDLIGKFQISQIIDFLKAGVYWKNLDGEILGCNQHFLDIFGIKDKRKIIGSNEYGFMQNEEARRIIENDLSVVIEGRYTGEEQFRLTNGQEITLFTVKDQLRDSADNVVGLVSTLLDISARGNLNNNGVHAN